MLGQVAAGAGASQLVAAAQTWEEAGAVVLPFQEEDLEEALVLAGNLEEALEAALEEEAAAHPAASGPFNKLKSNLLAA